MLYAANTLPHEAILDADPVGPFAGKIVTLPSAVNGRPSYTPVPASFWNAFLDYRPQFAAVSMGFISVKGDLDEDTPDSELTALSPAVPTPAST